MLIGAILERKTPRVVEAKDIERMREMLLGEYSVGAISKALGFSTHTVKYHLFPEYRARYVENRSEYKSTGKREVRGKLPPLQKPLEYASLTAFLLGDPAIGRSALDKKREAEKRDAEVSFNCYRCELDGSDDSRFGAEGSEDVTTSGFEEVCALERDSEEELHRDGLHQPTQGEIAEGIGDLE